MDDAFVSRFTSSEGQGNFAKVTAAERKTESNTVHAIKTFPYAHHEQYEHEKHVHEILSKRLLESEDVSIELGSESATHIPILQAIGTGEEANMQALHKCLPHEPRYFIVFPRLESTLTDFTMHLRESDPEQIPQLLQIVLDVAKAIAFLYLAKIHVSSGAQSKL